MKRSWPVHAFVVLSLLTLPVCALCQPEEAVVLAVPSHPTAARETANKAAAGPTVYLPADTDIPPAVQDLMRSCQQRYTEGSKLIKLGESAKAREAFNKAVDLVLRSEWDLQANPTLNRFFQDLIRRIQQDESRYLRPPDLIEEQPERAVVDELDKLDLIPIKVDPALADVVEADLANTKYDIPITLNERVLKSLNFWLSRGRKYFTDGLLRSGRYREMIQRIFREELVPLDLMYLAQVESLFKPNAVSRARARGIWQFGRWTAIRYGLKVNSYVDERSDPEKSTRAAARYLNDLYAMFKDWNLVLAAYNCGEGKVQRLIDRSGLNDFWDLMDLRRNFPAETKNHVPLIMASIILARNPEKYDLPKDLDPPLAYEQIPVSKPIDLKAAAKTLDIPLDQLKELNPALRWLATPADYPNFELKVPVGTDPDAARKLASLPAVKLRPPPSEFPGRYKVQPGDTLSGIAARYHVSAASLQEANDIRSPKALRAGSWISVPTARPPRIQSSSTKPKSQPTQLARTRIQSPPKSASMRKGSTAAKKPAGTQAAASSRLRQQAPEAQNRTTQNKRSPMP